MKQMKGKTGKLELRFVKTDDWYGTFKLHAVFDPAKWWVFFSITWIDTDNDRMFGYRRFRPRHRDTWPVGELSILISSKFGELYSKRYGDLCLSLPFVDDLKQEDTSLDKWKEI